MFGLDITADKLFNDPQMLTMYLDELSAEIEHRYIDRNELPLEIEANSEMKAAIEEIDKREDQLKLMIDFITILMDKSEEKMLMQSETLDKQELEINQLKEENLSRKTEFDVLKQLYSELSDNHKKLEDFLAESEHKHAEEKRIMAEAQTKIQSLGEIRDKYEDLQEETQQNSKIFHQLNEEKDELQAKLTIFKGENEHLKAELEFVQHKAEQFDNLNKEHIKLELKYEKVLKELESERLEFKARKNDFQAELTLKQEKIEKIQDDFKKIRKLALQRPAPSSESTDDLKENLNAKLANIPGYMQNRRRKSLTGESEGDDNLAEGSNLSIFESSQYDNMRGLSMKSRSKQSSDNIIIKETKAEPVSPTVKRKDIFEEFFLLSFQSALINSPHFDDLAGIDTKGLYDEVTQKDIPFHKWYTWLEQKLEDTYKNEILPQMKKWMSAQEQKV